MYKKRTVQFIAFLILLVSPLKVSAYDSYDEYPRTYKLYMELGKKAIDFEEYENAYNFFKYANMVAPEAQEPIHFLNLIKRVKEGRLSGEIKRSYSKPSYQDNTSKQHSVKERVVGNVSRERDDLISDTLDLVEKEYKKGQVEFDMESVGKAKEMLELPSNKNQRVYSEKGIINTSRSSFVKDEDVNTSKKKQVIFPQKKGLFNFSEPLYLDDEVANSQPNTKIKIELRKSLIIEGEDLKRFLVITPGVLDVELIGQDQIKLSANQRGTTFLHIWDQTKRWTFHVEVILPIRKDKIKLKELEEEERGEPFKFSYSADWASFYNGTTLSNVKRNNLNYIQWAGIFGETPYGKLDLSATFNMFDESTEVTGYGIGLENGKIGNFKDFKIRGFDTSKEFSALTLPGKNFRGFLLDAYAFDHRVAYSYVHGRDRTTFSRVSAGIQEKKESFIEGLKITLFPDQENNISFNFARGYGSAREDYLKERVFSVEGQRRVKDVLLSSEIAYDEENVSGLAKALYKKDNLMINARLRDINEDFTTITGRAGGRGEVGGAVTMNLNLENSDISSFIDIYRDRYLPNADNPDAVNIDFNTSINTSLTKTDRIINSFYYINTRGELSPREEVRLVSNYTKRVPLGNSRQLTAFLGGGYQMSRYELSPSSEYDSLSLSSGLNLNLYKGLTYYMNYQYNIVQEKSTGEVDFPNVFNSGLNYTKRFLGDFSAQASISYRNEENTEGKNSFLAGEDTLVGGLGLTYTPVDDFEVFVDGRVRNTWAENNNNNAFNDAEIRVGVRTSWESPFFWNPKGVVKGVVYKDLNGNQQQDDDEIGISGVSVKVGKKKVVTNDRGFYETKIRAKKVLVGIDIDTIPDGFVFSTKAFEKVEIIPRKKQKVDFGLTTQSGIYGVFFFDKNGNGKPDPEDDFVPNAKVILDSDIEILSDYEGTFFFRNILPGKHDLRIDINSLPMSYIPTVKLKKEIELSEGTTYVFHVPVKRVEKEEE